MMSLVECARRPRLVGTVDDEPVARRESPTLGEDVAGVSGFPAGAVPGAQNRPGFPGPIVTQADVRLIGAKALIEVAAQPRDRIRVAGRPGLVGHGGRVDAVSEGLSLL